MGYYVRQQNRKRSEATEQECLIGWCSLFENRYPELGLIYHVPNGGSRNPLEAANLKRQGVKAGVPDLCLPVPKKGYHGLYIEMKYGDNKTTAKQKEWLEALKEQGYKTVVCYGAEEAQEVLKEYLGIMQPDGLEEWENPEEVTAAKLIQILQRLDPETVVISGIEKNIRIYPGRENKQDGRNVLMIC